jgi:hypothetical protein
MKERVDKSNSSPNTLNVNLGTRVPGNHRPGPRTFFNFIF